MSRIETTFAALDRPALVTFITGGDPDYETSLEAFKGLAEAGADIIELGMPFTDPVADGPVIQQASERALAAGANMHRTFDMVREFRAENDKTPIVLMGYYNPIVAYGVETFAKTAIESGVDGLIIVDLPSEEGEALRTALAGQVDLIRLITPVTDEARLDTLLEDASGFLYYVSITGITGAAKASPEGLRPAIEAVKAKTNLPIAIGFGISTPEDAASMGAVADGIVVGSAIVRALNESGVDSALATVRALRNALD
ncbi:MAG: tryptophan synthase subunit alpha [Micavibrio sp.]|nr:tryptophan synthase subunit alpha [Micavibrio sp.]